MPITTHMNMGPRLSRLILAVLACAPFGALADFDPDAYPRYETCALCHGLFGVSHRDKFPHLGGQNPTYLEAQLRAFIAGTRHNDGGQMAAIVTELQPGDIALVVDWFSNQDPPEPSPLPDDNQGRNLLSELGCLGCHASVDPSNGIPHLTAQHSGYLAKQMADFRDGYRDAPDIAALHREALQISDNDIAKISDYLAGQTR